MEKVQLDNQGFTQYYDRLSRRIYDFVYYRVSHKQTAEDLTSEIFLKVFQNWQDGQSDAWVFTIARNQVIDFYRSRRDMINIESVFDLSDDQDIELGIDHKQKVEKIRSQLSSLTPLQRQIVIMRVWDELSYQEIADILEKNEGAIKMTFSRSIKTLKENIGSIAVLLLILGAKS